MAKNILHYIARKYVLLLMIYLRLTLQANNVLKQDKCA